MNLKRINYGVNIIYKSNNINLNKIINELDSKFIKYDINNEIESFINVEVISHQNKIKFFVDDIEYKTITEVINKYNIVPKLFSNNLINDKYEIKLNKLEHEKDIERYKIEEKYNSKFNKKFQVTSGINSIYEWYTGAIFFKDYEWNEIDNDNSLKKLFLEKNNGSYIYLLPLDTGIILRSYEIYRYVLHFGG